MTSSDIIALAALVVATSAMVVTIWQCWETRIHNRLSVRPHLDWGIARMPGKPIVLYVANCGLGPAIIKSVTLVLDEKAHPILGMELPDNIFREAEGSVSGRSEWSIPSIGTPIVNGEKINLFYFENSISAIARHNQAIAFLDRLGFDIEYSSMYEEKFSLKRAATTKVIEA